ncbi:chymotrypsin-1-like [Pieris napi]|uniref:chymotrypsin-1-like n=1 Tax=Pieris napi TaxID=78633 RepID=UPI001FB919E1|nr:chymotrypsin-1-like [Pieris napi]
MNYKTLLLSFCYKAVKPHHTIKMWKFIFAIFILSVLVEAEKVNPKRFAFIVSIRKDNQHICAGNIVFRNYIVTSALCVEGLKAKSLVIHIGTVNLNEKGDAYKVLEIKIHPNYNSKKYEYAAALLKTEDMEYKRTVNPVGVSGSLIGEGKELTAAGWKLKGDRSPNGLLQSKMVTSLSNNACGKKLKTSIPDSVICTENDSGYNKDREYFSDVGGPVLEKRSLVGVIVASNRPSNSSQPDINARMSSMLNWMFDTVVKS